MNTYKQPVSVLVVIHTADLDILLLERQAHPGYWQSVTGSQEGEESLIETARREVLEETGIDTIKYALTDWETTVRYEIYPEWRHRYAPGVSVNTEHWFSLRLPERLPVLLAPQEHRDFLWLPWPEAAAKVFSWSNRDAIRALAVSLPPQLTRT